MRRPGVRTGARIETSGSRFGRSPFAVAPVFAPGRGLKRAESRRSSSGPPVAPVFAPGRGLKLARAVWRQHDQDVAPVFAPGRGLKHLEERMPVVSRGRPGVRTGARIETP